ncbi:hypothetical protein HY839_04710 [Candidatus Azambacteria bacterium]|nr:hypothetical protein [Candidatus Azambacteria bacterium]
MPDWASNVVVHKHFWVSYDFRYAFGAASASPSKQWSKVDKRAKNALLTGLKIGTKINNIEIYHRWTDPNTGERYALARMPINLSPREQ